MDEKDFDRAEQTFDAFAAKFDLESDAWVDMDVSTIFVEGYLAALAQSDAEPSQDMRDRLAIYLMALDECGMGDNPQTHEGFFRNYLSEQRNSEHSGDCKKEPWTCTRCVCDEYLSKADHFLTAFPALVRSDATSETVQENRLHRARRFVQAVQGDLQHGLTGDQHVLMLDSVIDDIQAALAQSDAEPTVKMDWSLSEESKRQLEEIERATVRPGDARLNNVVGPRPDGQPDAEPDAWQYRIYIGGEWTAWAETNDPDDWRKQTGTEVRSLYTAPPRPDTSAGLIEAAEIAEQTANGSFSQNEAMYLRGFAARLRARAADRSGK